MAYEKQNFADGDTLTAAHLNHMEDGIEEAGTVQYVESIDEANIVNLRDLQSGSYALYGYFRPFSGAPNILTFGTKMMVNVARKTAASYVQVFSPQGNMVQHLAISDSAYEREDLSMSALAGIGTLSQLTTTDKTSLVAAINELHGLITA